MGCLDKAKGVAAEARQQARTIKEDLDERFSGDERYDKLLRAADDVGKKVTATSGDVRAGVEQRSAQLGATGHGAKVGTGVRKLSRTASRLPVLSAAGDAFKTKNCVDLLLSRYLKEPANPERALCLAEALTKTKQDMSKYRAARGMVDQSSFFVAVALQQAGALGTEALSSSDRLLRGAYKGAIVALGLNNRDAQALHVLARVYLATGYPESAKKLATVATRLDHGDARIPVTLARAYYATGDATSAKGAGELAVKRGSSMGHGVIAQVDFDRAVADRSGTLGSRLRAYQQGQERVSIGDRRAYFGAARDAEEIGRALKEVQLRKAKKTWARARAAVERET